MHIYLPIAEMSVNSFLLLGMGVGVGMLSGMFGLGGFRLVSVKDQEFGMLQGFYRKISRL